MRIFYSWIADQPRESNRAQVLRAITEALHQAANRLGTSPNQGEVVQCDRFGTPTDIARFIVEAIPTCHAFVGDVSFINAPGEARTRRAPNPNTMFEIGLATQCLGPGKVILVFNTDSGPIADLPFDIRNHSVITWSDADSPAQLARALREPVETAFRAYLAIMGDLAHEFTQSFGPLLDFLKTFMERHLEDPRRVTEFMELFHTPTGVGPCTTADLAGLKDALLAYRRPFLDDPEASAAATEGSHFAVVLQRLHLDCERLAYRHRLLQGSNLFRHVERLGIEAGHLEWLLGRILNKAPNSVVNGLIDEEILRFVGEAVAARRCIASRGANHHPG